jgi:hypothetical protein
MGAYYTAGVMLSLAFLEQSESSEESSEKDSEAGSEKTTEAERSKNSWSYRRLQRGRLAALPATSEVVFSFRAEERLRTMMEARRRKKS